MSSIRDTRTDEASKLFQEALQSFTDSIPPADRDAFREFKDAQTMVASIEAISKSHHVQDSRITAAFRKFEGFVAYLEPYFQIVDTFVSAKPECAALVWGSLRMIFKACCQNHRPRWLRNLAAN
ncbi:hypothetical protein Daus18300_003581 [Diaporthe australafricana]|uniref:DUF7708 domain-containing protein n=1 Tax=Diaporthe australafricana TaxID=127596 RepID=A0ABR3XF53_9PEZI